MLYLLSGEGAPQSFHRVQCVASASQPTYREPVGIQQESEAPPRIKMVPRGDKDGLIHDTTPP